MAKKSENKKDSKKVYLIEIVDGHVQTAVSISQFLRFLGYETTEAYDADSAVKIAKSKKPALILIDTTLDGTGEDVAKQLSGVKIIFMGEGGKIGGNIIGRVKKPIDNEELEKTIKKFLK